MSTVEVEKKHMTHSNVRLFSVVAPGFETPQVIQVTYKIKLQVERTRHEIPFFIHILQRKQVGKNVVIVGALLSGNINTFGDNAKHVVFVAIVFFTTKKEVEYRGWLALLKINCARRETFC